MVPSPVIDAAMTILADGKARTADEILAAGVKRGLFTAGMTRKRVYTALSQYVERAAGRGRKPRITEDAEHRFMLNHAPDDWPDLDVTGLPPLTNSIPQSADAQSAIDSLQRAATQTDPTAFEIAVCEAFNKLGFIATHIGGNGQPDGYADALLGPLAYRIMIECKLSADIGDSHSAAAAEAAKFKESYHGTFCILVAPSFEGEVTFASELQVHNVSAWTVDDLTRVLSAGCNAFDAKALLRAGFAEDALDDFLWGRLHGRAKRLRVIASVIIQEGLRQQRLDRALGDGSQAPHFTVDVAMSVVDTFLGANGTTAACNREDVQAAFAWLTSPYVGRAVWLNQTHDAIVLLTT
jgi:DNA-binding phage protein